MMGYWNKRKAVHLRLNAVLLKRVDHYAVERDVFRSEAIEELLRLGLEDSRDDDLRQQSGLAPGPLRGE